MALEPVYPGDAVEPTSEALPPGSVRLSDYKQQLIGIRTLAVARQSANQTVHAVGRIAVDETRVDRVSALADGVVRSVSSYGAGSIVHKDEVLATYFVASRDIYNAMQAFVLASGTFDQAASAVRNGMINSSKANSRTDEELLKSYGVTAAQIRDLSRTREVTRDIDFRAPISGLVLARNVSRDQVVTRGTELFRMADLSHVWVLADVFENDVRAFRTGAAAQVRYAGRVYQARISDARQFDPSSRTLAVRLEMDNPGMTLRPDMFVEVQVDVQGAPGLSVPLESVLDAGRSKVVFVAAQNGVFAPRQITLGTEYDDRVQVLTGLSEGERVVTAGMFLLDSESRLRNATVPDAPSPLLVRHGAGALPLGHADAAATADPVCGMPLSENGSETAVYQGATFHFCSAKCKSKFKSDPARYSRSKNSASSATGGRSNS